MLVLSNDDIERLLTMEDCIAALESMYRDYATGHAPCRPASTTSRRRGSTEPATRSSTLGVRGPRGASRRCASIPM